MRVEPTRAAQAVLRDELDGLGGDAELRAGRLGRSGAAPAGGEVIEGEAREQGASDEEK